MICQLIVIAKWAHNVRTHLCNAHYKNTLLHTRLFCHAGPEILGCKHTI